MRNGMRGGESATSNNNKKKTNGASVCPTLTAACLPGAAERGRLQRPVPSRCRDNLEKKQQQIHPPTMSASPTPAAATERGRAGAALGRGYAHKSAWRRLTVVEEAVVVGDESRVVDRTHHAHLHQSSQRTATRNAE